MGKKEKEKEINEKTEVLDEAPPPYGEKAQFDPPPYTKPELSILVPSAEEVVAHLKILHAFHTLHVNVEANFKGTEGLTAEKIWQLFVTVAVRRFNVFVSALRWKYADNVNGLVEFVRNTLPPIDILMVWHSFLLNPISFSTNFSANEFKNFTVCPFPVVEVANHLACDWPEKNIKTPTFTLAVPEECSQEFTNFIESYYLSQDIDEEFTYNPLEEFSIAYEVPLSCPRCNITWRRVPFYKENVDYGFACSEFCLYPTTRCGCLRDSDIYLDHEILRRILLHKDSSKPAVLSLVAKNYHHGRNSMSVEQVDAEVKELARQLDTVRWVSDLMASRDQLNPVTVSALRDYNEINLISATIPTSGKVIIREDLVACVMRQRRFIVQMVEELLWLHSESLIFTIEEAIGRYKNFFSLMRTSSSVLVPTLDIDLVWHTHQLSQNRYFEYSIQVAGTIIDHNDKIEQNRLDDAFQKTCTLYREKFKTSYAICHCEYCTKNRKRTLFRKEKGPTPLIGGKDYNNNHISTHNSVLIPTARGLGAAKLADKKYRSIVLKPYMSEAFGGTFVTDPHNPTSPETLPFYENGCQMNHFDTVSACSAGEAGLARGQSGNTSTDTGSVLGGTSCGSEFGGGRCGGGGDYR